MAILPGAIVKIVARHDTLRTKMNRGVCLHIAVSDGASLYNYFNTPGNPTSHFYVRKTGNTNGMADFEQYVDTKYQAPAQLDGNPTLVSIETQGGVGSDLNAGWTATQRERISWILAQCKLHHSIPLTAMPNSKPASTGIGYHKLGIDPWRVSDGEHWSSSYAKECPGSARISQVPSIITRAQQIYTDLTEGTDVSTPTDTVGTDADGTPMTMAELASRLDFVYRSILEGGKVDGALDNICAQVADTKVRANVQAENEEYGTRFWSDPSGTGTALRADVDDIQARVTALEAAVATTDAKVQQLIDGLLPNP